MNKRLSNLTIYDGSFLMTFWHFAEEQSYNRSAWLSSVVNFVHNKFTGYSETDTQLKKGFRLQL